MLSLAGGALGVAGGFTIAALIRLIVPALPLSTSLRYVVAALLTSVVVGC